MTTETKLLEQRVTEIENELKALKSVVAQTTTEPWWRRIIGEFEGDEGYAEIVRLGSEMRNSERTE